MFETKVQKLKSRIESAIQIGSISPKNGIILFGSGDESRNAIKILREFGISVLMVLDNSPAKNGSYCAGIPVRLPNNLNSNEDNALFILYSPFHNEMKAQLLRLGIKEDKIFDFTDDSSTKHVTKRMEELLHGWKTYKMLKKKAGNGAILLCPYTGTGDIYLIGTLLPYYLEKNDVKNYILVVIGNGCAKVAKIFGIDNIEKICMEECEDLLFYYALCPDKCDIKILNDDWGDIFKTYNGPVKWVRGYRNQNFTDMFRRYVFELEDSVKPRHPKVPKREEEVMTILREAGVRQGLTVILSPYSNTLADLPESFWTYLAKSIKDRRLDVATNCGPGEQEICGTAKLSFPLDISIQVLNAAGYFIGIRSGFCDIASGSSCRKIILYDKNNTFSMATAFEYFSLKRMGLSDDAIEIEFDSLHTNECMEDIINNLKVIT